MKTVLNAPGTKRLKLYSDELLSSFAFNVNLRRCKLEGDHLESSRRAHDAEEELGTLRSDIQYERNGREKAEVLQHESAERIARLEEGLG